MCNQGISDAYVFLNQVHFVNLYNLFLRRNGCQSFRYPVAVAFNMNFILQLMQQGRKPGTMYCSMSIISCTYGNSWIKPRAFHVTMYYD